MLLIERDGRASPNDQSDDVGEVLQILFKIRCQPKMGLQAADLVDYNNYYSCMHTYDIIIV